MPLEPAHFFRPAGGECRYAQFVSQDMSRAEVDAWVQNLIGHEDVAEASDEVAEAYVYSKLYRALADDLSLSPSQRGSRGYSTRRHGRQLAYFEDKADLWETRYDLRRGQAGGPGLQKVGISPPNRTSY